MKKRSDYPKKSKRERIVYLMYKVLDCLVEENSNSIEGGQVAYAMIVESCLNAELDDNQMDQFLAAIKKNVQTERVKL